MRSITLGQAAFFAALAMLLLAGYQLIDNAELLESSPALVIVGSTVPSLVWAGFFFVVYGVLLLQEVPRGWCSFSPCCLTRW